MSIASDNGAWLCTPGNSSCNYDIGSDNFFKGKVKYANYGYNVTEWNAIVFVAAFGVMTCECLCPIDVQVCSQARHSSSEQCFIWDSESGLGNGGPFTPCFADRWENSLVGSVDCGLP